MRRLERLRLALEQENIPALLVTGPANRLYLSGFTGESGYLLVTRSGRWLLTDGRFVEQAREEAPAFEIVRVGRDPWKALGEAVARAGVDEVYVEEEHLTVAAYRRLKEAVGAWPRRVVLKRARGVVEKLRLTKEGAEIEVLRQAISIADRAFDHILPYLRPGVRERDIALELEYFMRREGAGGAAFPTIVASGPRSALPHGVAGERRLAPGDLVVLDFGAVCGGYHSDLTRTVALGPVTPEQRRVYDKVRTAQSLALEGLRAGVPGREVDARARSYLEEAGFKENFSHGLGHGVGLEVHEGPSLSPGAEEPLEAGMVVTVEPGVYIAGWGGVRIEDVALVAPEGCRVLSQATREFLVL
ncbi:MAG TPA: Xaa-Pro dipeptidase [Peptococcaceae bacterium]|nr:MAG: Peptidase M24 [Moorella sp. 60_41]HBT47163.1 Xaa-Pro dipeptidase [Peptococcaceae bacterium]